MMNANNGVKIFRSSRNIPTLLAYKRIDDKYLTLIYRKKKLYLGMHYYTEIIDWVPIRSRSIIVNLPVPNENDICEIMKQWIELIKKGIKDYDRDVLHRKEDRKEKVKLNMNSQSPPKRNVNLNSISLRCVQVPKTCFAVNVDN